jgi:hypothetical protein
MTRSRLRTTLPNTHIELPAHFGCPQAALHFDPFGEDNGDHLATNILRDVSYMQTHCLQYRRQDDRRQTTDDRAATCTVRALLDFSLQVLLHGPIMNWQRRAGTISSPLLWAIPATKARRFNFECHITGNLLFSLRSPAITNTFPPLRSGFGRYSLAAHCTNIQHG